MTRFEGTLAGLAHLARLGTLRAWLSRTAAVSTCLLGFSLQSVAAPAPPAPGEYLTLGGWGQLSVVQVDSNKTRFELSAFGVNGSSCSLGGEIQDGLAIVASPQSDTACRISFASNRDGINVKPVSGDCRTFCSAHSSFEGLYRRPAEGCDSRSLSLTRDRFKLLFDTKAYRPAYEVLAPVLTQCRATLANDVQYRIRNDLALTQFKLFDFDGCLRTLEPLARDAARKDEEARRTLAQVDAEEYISILQTTRMNLKLCRGKA